MENLRISRAYLWASEKRITRLKVLRAKRGFQNVSSTVDEQLSWFKEHTGDYFKTVFSIEKTNSKSAVADLVVNGENWGAYSSTELLRLKSILDGKMRAMIDDIPVRPEAVIWKKSDDHDFANRNVMEGDIDQGFSKTTIKKSYILVDPHPDIKRPPMLGEESTQVNIGKYSTQDFSGAYSMRQRAELKVKYDVLYKSVIEALENANNIDSVESDLGDKLLDYLF